MRVLLLGGTAEARELAEALVRRGDQVLTSLAGAVSAPLLPAGDVRVSPIGGIPALVEILRSLRATALVDATHPFAAGITAKAVAAAAEAEVPLTVVRRPLWMPGRGDRWTSVRTVIAAAAVVRDLPVGCAFLTTGRRDLSAFAEDPRPFLVRTIEEPDGALPATMTLVRARGPFTVDGELALLRSYDVKVLVSKNSGGSLTAAKLAAARTLALPVVMVERPGLPPGVVPVDTVAAVLERLSATRR